MDTSIGENVKYETKRECTGMVSNIQRFSLDDGPGIRTTVFLKGCNLRCKWCHNPECIPRRPVLQFTERLCLNCGRCQAVCPEKVHRVTPEAHTIDFSSCIACGACVRECPADALKINGTKRTVSEVMKVIMSDWPYYQTSGGGATFSGGEPMLQIEFLENLLEACKSSGVTTAVDTAGNVPWENYERILNLTDVFLYDVKAYTPELSVRACGVPNGRILDNLQRLSDKGCRIFIRIPVIPGYNATHPEMEKIAAWICEHASPERIELLPYHDLGAGKYQAMGIPYEMADTVRPDEETMEEFLHIFEAKKLPVKIS